MGLWAKAHYANRRAKSWGSVLCKGMTGSSMHCALLVDVHLALRLWSPSPDALRGGRLNGALTAACFSRNYDVFKIVRAFKQGRIGRFKHAFFELTTGDLAFFAVSQFCIRRAVFIIMINARHSSSKVVG